MASLDKSKEKLSKDRSRGHDNPAPCMEILASSRCRVHGRVAVSQIFSILVNSTYIAAAKNSGVVWVATLWWSNRSPKVFVLACLVFL